MKEKPILFNTEMVQAILDGRKTQTRRPIKPQPELYTGRKFVFPDSSPKKYHDCADILIHNPFGGVGDQLWIRETFYQGLSITTLPSGEAQTYWDSIYEYCDERNKNGVHLHNSKIWMTKRPSIHMPREASRINLKVKHVWLERIQSITRSDIRAEGIACPIHLCSDDVSPNYKDFYPKAFQNLWDSIYEPQGLGWSENPWVWACEFEVVA